MEGAAFKAMLQTRQFRADLSALTAKNRAMSARTDWISSELGNPTLELPEQRWPQ